MTNEANSTAVQVPEKTSNGAATERGVAGGRGNTDLTVFVSNLPFNVTADELREKFKHVSLYVSLLPLVCVIVTPCVCHYCPSCVSMLPCIPLCIIRMVVIGYSVVILLISDWLISTSGVELVSLAMWNFSLK